MTEATLPTSEAMRRKYAYALMMAGADTSPVQAWTQGAARVLQGALGGYEWGKLNREDKAARAELQNLPGLEQGSSGATSSGPPVPFGAKSFVPPATNGRIYSNDEPSPLDPPSGQDRDLAIRTMYAEAANEPPVGQQAVANVIRNRAVAGNYGGDTPTGVVTARNQFEPWNTQAGRAKMAALDPNGSTYGNLSHALDKAYTGDDPTNGATNFFAPKAQAALGRPVPAWGAGPGQDIGNHRFFGGGPGVGNAAIGEPNGIMPQRSTVAIPPDVAVSIRRMLANPATEKYGLALYAKFAGPTDRYEPVTDARGQAIGQRSTLTGEIKSVPQDPEAIRIVQEMRANPRGYGFRGPDDPALHEAMQKRLSGMSSNVSVNTAANPVLEGVGKQIVASRERAYNAVDAIKMGHDARALLDEGMTTGAFADPRVMMQKFGALFGMDASQASNAEVFRGVIGNQVLGHIKALGANPSNADRDYIEKIQGGQIALEEQSLRRLLDINEKYSRQAIQRFNSDSKKLIDANPDQYRAIAPLMQFDEPQPYQRRGGGSIKEKYGLE